MDNEIEGSETMNNNKDFITQEAEIKYLKDRISYLELENENLRLKLKLAETEKPRPEEKKKKQKCILRDPLLGDLCEFYTNIPDYVEYRYPGFTALKFEKK